MSNTVTSALLNKYSEHIVHFTTTRKGGVSNGNYDSLNLSFFCGDDSTFVQQNRAILCKQLGISPTHLITAHQTHGVNVKLVDDQTVSQPDDLQGYDALITNLHGICIAVSTADCVPILLFDPENNAIAAIHSGWRSTAENICQHTICQMNKHFGSKAENIVAAIGPCISGANYEVGEELFVEFQQKGFDVESFFTPIANGKFLFDIRKAVHRDVELCGVQSIEVSDLCTFAREDLFFSARKSGIHSGRMLSGILLK
jgi:YfiH family protein